MAELISIPLKKSSDVDIVKPLKNLVQSTYNTEEYNDALEELGRLRSNAIWKVFEKNSLDVIYNYYDQLVSLETKFPPQEVQIPFKWKDAFDKGSIFGGRMSLIVSSLSYERVCVEFNMAALQSACAAAEQLDSEDSLKNAARLLQQAAGLLADLRTRVLAAVHSDPTPDLQPETLQALSQLMLAQAQEVFVYKCIRDDMKDAMAAKVCAQAAELYADAHRTMARDQLKPLWERDWLSLVAAKQRWMAGLAHHYQAGVCRTATDYGQELARLDAAAELLEGARGPSAEVLRRVLARRLQARKDNDFIYHARVTPREQLEPVGRAPVARALPPPARWGTASDLLGGLAPAAVGRAAAAADQRRAAAVHAEVDRLREATQLLNATLASLGLPAALDRGGAMPDATRAQAAALKDKGGVPALRALMAELPELLQRNRDVLDEAERLLREEADADSALRSQFGARWTRTPSDRLTETFRANADKYRQIIDNAVRADKIVRDKFEQHVESMERLCGSEVASGLGGAPPAAPEPEARVRALLAELDELRAERDALEAELLALRLDVRAELEAAHAAGTLDEPALSAAALGTALGPLRERVGASLRRQEETAARLAEAHAELARARGGPSARDEVLARLTAAHDAYQELTGNLQEGVKFYNDLTQLLVTFQNKVSDYCFARRTEKEELLKDLTQEASRASRPAPAPPAALPAAPPAAPQPAAPQPAALPYPMQPQGMPLPYAYAPMPGGYNPYATLPFPQRGYPQPYPPPQPYAPPYPHYNPYPHQ